MPTEEDQSPLQSPRTAAMASWTMMVILIALALTAANAVEWGGPEKGTALATWSGAADGAGSEGTRARCLDSFCKKVTGRTDDMHALTYKLVAGECGYFQAVKETPWLSMVTAVPP